MPSSETKRKSSNRWGCWGLFAFIFLSLFILSWCVISALMREAKKNAASSDLRMIIVTYVECAKAEERQGMFILGNEPRVGRVSSPAQFAETLARFGGLSMGEIWYIDADRALGGKIIPDNVLSRIDDGANNLALVRPISWAVVINVPKDRWGDAKCPILWTRGLKPDGTWSKDSPWDGDGGHIAFADGHIRWYSDLNSEGNRLAKFSDGTETSNIFEAIGPDAVVLEDKIEKKK